MNDPVSVHLARLRSGSLATDLRIPLIDGLNPAQAYVLCVAVSVFHWGGEMPTDQELQLLRRYLDYRLAMPWNTPSPNRPFDIDPGVNTVIFLKRAEGDWSYRFRSWSMGPTLWPSLQWAQTYDLAQLLDKIEHDSPKWNDFQAEHPAL